MKQTKSEFFIDDSWSPSQRTLLERALGIADSHPNQQKASEYAAILRDLRVDHEIIAAAIIFALGSGVDTSALDPKIVALCEESFRLIAEEDGWVARLETQSDTNAIDTQQHHMMLLSMMKDVRVVFILLAHQLWIMRNLKNESEAHQKAEAWETRAIFAPLANRLGIGQLKWELEDWAFRYLDAEHYISIAKRLEERREDRENYISHVVDELTGLLDEAGILAKVYGRPKHIYSIWKKMQNKHLEFEELYDVRALRVMVEDIGQCYAALSAVHSRWPFIPGEYDDYISAPKSNNYQSLHTAVIGPEGKTIEIQIRTWDMHEHAELGVAAHWRYKEGGQRDHGLEKRIEQLRQLLEDGNNVDEELESQQTDTTNVFVLTPKGQVVELPYGATPLDFAYHVHTDVGHRCRGAKVNGTMVPLTSKLKSGDYVEIVTSKNGQPSRDWVSPSSGYLASSRARSKVRQWFKQQFREENISAGKAALHREAIKRGIQEPKLDGVASRFNLNSEDDVLAAIGRGELGAAQVFNLVLDTHQQVEEKDEIAITGTGVKPEKSGKVQVFGMGDLMTHMARCCKPMPGDDVIGFITRGRGVSIHRASCSNIKRLADEHDDRIIDVSWGQEDQGSYEVDIEIEAMDRSGLLRDVTSVLASEDVNVMGANTHTNRKTHEAQLKLTLEINNTQKLDRALARLRQLRGVFDAVRIK